MSLRTYFANYGFPVVFTRAANVYGPGQQLYRLPPRISGRAEDPDANLGDTIHWDEYTSVL